MPISSFKPLATIIAIISMVATLGYVYKRIYDSGALSVQLKWDKDKLEWKNKQAQQQIKYDQLFQIKQQENESLTQSIIKQNNDRENQYNDIKTKLNQSNANLAVCKLNNSSLLELQRAANTAIRTNTTKSTIQQSTGITSNDNSRIPITFNCRDLSVTSIAWANLYFQAKDQADGWKQWYLNNFLNNNGKSYIIDK